MRIIILALLFIACSCKPEPAFYKDGKGYYVRVRCLKDTSWTSYGYRFGYSYRGKYEFSYGPIYNYKCLESKTDTSSNWKFCKK